jgi:surfeit locus 1 family protein
VTFASASARTYVAIAGLLLLGTLFAALGAWQLERAEQSRATLARFAAGANEAVLTLPPRELTDDARFRRLEVRGELVADPQFLLDNMLHEGVSGYHVLTALRVPGLSEHVLVNRGWLAAGGDRRVLPDVTVIGGARLVTGRIERLPRPGLRLGAAPPSGPATGVVVLQYPTADELAALFGEAVLDYQLLLDPAEPGGYLRDWRAPGVPPERNLGYAGQWFALAIGAVAAAVVMMFRTGRRKP